MQKGQDSTEHVTLEETVNKFFETRKTNSQEFKALIEYYGKPRLSALYKKWFDAREAGKKKEI